MRADGSRDEWDDSRPSAKKGRKPATGAVARSAGTARAGTAASTLLTRKALPPEIAAEIRNAADVLTALQRERLVERAESAYGAYERARYQDALRAIKPVVEQAPGVAAVRELTGLAAYRAGKWREALRHLQAFTALQDSTEHLPVMMDCERALRKPKKVADLWSELRQSSPEPDVLAEGRIVAAASLADSGKLQDAISLLVGAGASKALRNPSNRHVRQWYLLADLYERAGDVPRAREFFERVLLVDRDAYDVADRLAGLGPVRKTRPRAAARGSAARHGSTGAKPFSAPATARPEGPPAEG